MRVLLADDQAAVRWALRMFLQEHDFEIVAEAGRGGELLLKAQRSQAELVLLDWEMTGMMPLSFPIPSPDARSHRTDRLKAILISSLHHLMPGPLVVVLSDHPDARSAALAAGADGFLYKGEPPERLLALLQEIS